jgi:hypothetical protein
VGDLDRFEEASFRPRSVWLQPPERDPPIDAM